MPTPGASRRWPRSCGSCLPPTTASSLALVGQTRAALLATARTTLQARLDRISEILIEHPDMLRAFDEEAATIHEHEARFHVANMMLAVFKEALTHYLLEDTMPDEDWHAW